MTEDFEGLSEPVPAFAAHFTDPLYDDAGDDLAPFGSDEGSDLLATWTGRRDELGPTSTLATVLECDPSEVAACAGPMTGVDGIETAGFITSAAFVLLRLVGHLGEDDRRLALEALDFQIRMLPEINSTFAETPAVLRTQRDDLASWRNPE
ncbi:hypothetical protein [Nocardioides panaciterrulae]|uniref:Uncharacterized protein YfeS n=1 Tax=Nocardioides panaciterrulae TaxID=661492 RepID=A0A7Y9E6F9_9ACTN|nr:hypothetical protein [Nocardioides panaciterrulae]NYD41969.1 uncharacterized protein YfeS [Nocardioides panaciterrulae]